MPLIDYKMLDHVALVGMNNGENRFNNRFLDEFLGVLDEVEAEPEARVLVVTSAHEKIFSNGIDLEWLAPRIEKEGPKAGLAFIEKLCSLNRRILMFPMITVAAINGHAFAGGAIMVSAFDFRFMRSDRGYFCLPEVDIGIPLMPGMVALVKKAVPMHVFLEMQYTGLRLTGADCERHGIIKKACSQDELVDQALEFAKGLKKDRGMIAEMKRITNKEILRVMDEDDPHWLKTGRTGLV